MLVELGQLRYNAFVRTLQLYLRLGKRIVMSLILELALAGIVIALPLLAYARLVEPFRVSLRRETLELEDLPPGLDGLTILHLSDLHLRKGDHGRAELIRRVSDVEADIIAITGDFIETDDDVDFCLRTIQGLRARYGIFGVLGNHDHMGDRHFLHTIFKCWQRSNDVQGLIRRLEGIGIKVLVNEGVPVRIDGQDLWVVGVDDPYKRLHNVPLALRGIPPEGYKLLLAHSPDVVDQIGSDEVNLILCGHTHGGQIVFPLLGALVTRTRRRLRRAWGWHRVGKTSMHISRGIASSLMLRLGCPPEANLIQLKHRPCSLSEVVILSDLGRRTTGRSIK